MKDLGQSYAAAPVNVGVGDAPIDASDAADSASRFEVAAYRLSQWLRSPRPYLMLLGFALFSVCI